ncbi:MAG: hypothetical protein JWM31_2633, partial [Solirubrobacterales bacterium]|nr:hypothetical protein [Solirubrobacterales bacterium]
GGATTVQRRRLALALGLSALLAIGVWVAGLGSDEQSGAGAAEAARAKVSLPQLPGGGRTIFPRHRIVAFAGNPQDEELGVLGIGSPATAVRKLRRQAAAYARRTRPVLPALELISSVAAAAPGAAGDHVIRADFSTIDRYLRAARKAKALLLLDIQPGLVDFPSEVKRLQKYLIQPDVGVALDPEWRVQPGQIPGQVIGSVTAAEVNLASEYVAQLVYHNHLPEKLFVVHQFTEGMVTQPEQLVKRPGLAMVFNVDGVGARPNKVSKYRSLAAAKPQFRHGFKLFYKEDTGLMKPGGVMALTPRPDLVIYE